MAHRLMAGAFGLALSGLIVVLLLVLSELFAAAVLGRSPLNLG